MLTKNIMKRLLMITYTEIPTFDIKKMEGFPKIPKLLIIVQLCYCCCYLICKLDCEVVWSAVGSVFQKKNGNVPSKHHMNEKKM